MAVKGSHRRGPLGMIKASFLEFFMLIMFCFVILILLAFGVFSISSGGSSNGFSSKAHEISNIPHKGGGGDDDDTKDDRRSNQWVEVISWEPRVSVYHNFLSKKECEHLINIAKPHMFKSSVVEDGKIVDSRARTSTGTFLAIGRDQIVKNIEKRIADLTFIPVENGEPLQVLHYEVGQKYDPHHDYFRDEFYTRRGGQRIATLLMYLSDVEEGGETVFPAARGNFSPMASGNDLSDCGKRGLSVKPKMGDALLFWNMRPNASVDPLSWHGSCQTCGCSSRDVVQNSISCDICWNVKYTWEMPK